MKDKWENPNKTEFTNMLNDFMEEIDNSVKEKINEISKKSECLYKTIKYLYNEKKNDKL